MNERVPVLIAGAGPTGLVLAISLARRGVKFRLIDRAQGPGEQSRAMAVHARTLEAYQQFGFADDVVARGMVAKRVHLREARADGAGHEVLTLEFKELGDGISPFPFMLAFPQDDHERFLGAQLRAAGGVIEWGATLADFTQDEHGVRAEIRHADGRAELVDAGYLCGCDGAHSRVRQVLGVGFDGGDYEQLFYVADVKLREDRGADMFVSLGARALALLFPVRSSGMHRLLGLVPPELSQRRDVTFEDIRSHAEPLMDVHVTEVNWFSAYHVHHRVAARFHVGRAFLLGDAGHIHSPTGGQGMNTGIGDAVNLGWKLAHVAQGRAPAALLDSYEPERIAFARTLVDTTDRVFGPLVDGGWGGTLVRRVVAPAFMAVATRVPAGRRAFFRMLSQTRIHYPDSALSVGRAGAVHGGDRLPWTGAETGAGTGDNFTPLRSLDWQVHVYGAAEPGIVAACDRTGIPMHVLPWSTGAENAGLERDAAYLIRPDGYVALAAHRGSAGAEIEAYAGRVGLRGPATAAA